MNKKNGTKTDHQVMDLRACTANTMRASMRSNQAENEMYAVERDLQSRHDQLLAMVTDLIGHQVAAEDVISMATWLFSAHRQLEERRQIMDDFMQASRARDRAEKGART